MSTPDTSYDLDGVALDDPQGRWFVDSATEAPPTPGLRSGSIVAAGIDGEVFTPNDPYEAGVMSMTVNVTDEDPGGEPSYAALHRNFDLVKGLFLSRQSLHVLTKTQGGVRRVTDARVAASTVPKELDGRTIQITFVIELPLPLWHDERGVDWVGADVLHGATLQVAPLDGATARCGRGQLRASGPLQRIRFTDETTEQWVDVQYPVPAGSELWLNLGDLRAKVLDGAGGEIDITGRVDVGPGGFNLTPRGGITRVIVSREQGGSVPSRVRGTNLKRSFL